MDETQGSAGPMTGVAPTTEDVSLELVGITKSFGDLVAVDGVSLAFRRGEVHAVLGENGAGKTTLMNTAAGFLAPDAGTVLVNGQPMLFRIPADALRAGIGMVHQHFRLIEQLTVAENLVIGAHDVKPILRQKDLVNRSASLEERFGLAVDPQRPVWGLSVGEKQRVEILRVLDRGARILILDEPTAVLSPSEAEALCDTLRRMAREDGVTVVFISHKLKEVLSVADSITVMRRGKIVQTLPRESCDIDRLGRLMVGDERHADMLFGKVAENRRAPGDVVLEVEGLEAQDDRGLPALSSVSFTVRQSEIVGVAGVAGNGQKELEEVLTGLRRPAAGSIRLHGGDLAGRPVKIFRRGGLGYIPEDRRGVGLVGSEPIWRNSVMRSYASPPVTRGPLFSRAAARRYSEALAKRVKLSTEDPDALVGHLSGGNAQKLLAGRELDMDPKLLVAVNPTQGLDVGAVDAVWQQLSAARELQVAVLLISADLDELLGLADRTIVLYEGRIVGELGREHMDRHRIGLLMGGAELEDPEAAASSD